MPRRSPAPVGRGTVRTSTVLLVIAAIALGWTLLGLLVSDALARPFVNTPHPVTVHPVAPAPTTADEPPGWRVAPW